MNNIKRYLSELQADTPREFMISFGKEEYLLLEAFYLSFNDGMLNFHILNEYCKRAELDILKVFWALEKIKKRVFNE